MNKNKTVAILFSGGLDSTYLFYKNLEEGNKVIPIYITIKNNTTKVAIEKRQIQLIYNSLGEHYPHLMYNIRYPLEVNIFDISDRLYFKQIPIWILGMLYSELSSEVDEIQIGYVMNDDAISYLDEIRASYESFNHFSEGLPKLVFPLSKLNKAQIKSKLPKKFADLTFSCEDPEIIGTIDNIINIKECGKCHPCCRKKEIGMGDNLGKYREEDSRTYESMGSLLTTKKYTTKQEETHKSLDV